jgi:hypothetical protein
MDVHEVMFMKLIVSLYLELPGSIPHLCDYPF